MYNMFFIFQTIFFCRTILLKIFVQLQYLTLPYMLAGFPLVMLSQTLGPFQALSLVCTSAKHMYTYMYRQTDKYQCTQEFLNSFSKCCLLQVGCGSPFWDTAWYTDQQPDKLRFWEDCFLTSTRFILKHLKSFYYLLCQEWPCLRKG